MVLFAKKNRFSATTRARLKTEKIEIIKLLKP